MSDLTSKKCVPCESGAPPLNKEEIEKLEDQIASEWNILENKKLERKFKFGDFKESMSFVNEVADIAEAEQHHPDIKIFYSLVTITLWTHAVGGLSENDFILAAKIDKITS